LVAAILANTKSKSKGKNPLYQWVVSLQSKGSYCKKITPSTFHHPDVFLTQGMALTRAQPKLQYLNL